VYSVHEHMVYLVQDHLLYFVQEHLLYMVQEHLLYLVQVCTNVLCTGASVVLGTGSSVLGTGASVVFGTGASVLGTGACTWYRNICAWYRSKCFTWYKQTNKQTINHHSVEVRAETSSKIATLAINVPIGDTLSSVANCRSTDTLTVPQSSPSRYYPSMKVNTSLLNYY